MEQKIDKGMIMDLTLEEMEKGIESIKGFIEAIVALFEKETAAPVQDQKSKDNARSSDRDDVRRFENPLSDGGQQDAMSKYASAGVIGIIAAHELITDASVFGD